MLPNFNMSSTSSHSEAKATESKENRVLTEMKITQHRRPTTNPVSLAILSLLGSKLLEFSEEEIARQWGEELTGGVSLLPELWMIFLSYCEETDFFLNLLRKQVMQDNDLINDLWTAVYDSKDQKESAAFAANAITLLNAVGMDFNGLDLSGIKIAGANLGGAQLDNANLQEADLRGVSFSGSWLRKCNLNRAHLDKARWGELPKITLSDAVNVCCYSEDFRYLAVVCGQKIYVYDGLTHKLFHTFEKHTNIVTSVAFGPGGLLASGSADRTVRLWDVNQKKLVATFVEHTNMVTSVAFGPGGLLASGSYDNTVRLWDTCYISSNLRHNVDFCPALF